MILGRFFTIEYNRLAAARQEYELAKEHYAEVLKHRNALNPEHNRRFADAHERLEEAREKYLGVLTLYG